MTTHTCTVCGNGFTPVYQAHKRAKYCSQECRRKQELINNGRSGKYIQGIPSATVGAINELKAASFLMERGWNVFRALSPACFCDLVAFKEGDETMFVEVRTGYISYKGKMSYSARTIHKGATHFLVITKEPDKEFNLFPVRAF